MTRVAKTIDVDVPVRTAYDQWTQFEEFPRFMEGVEEVRQLDDRHLYWRGNIAGRTEEWEAEIREQVPDQTIIWVNTLGPENAGVVRFDSLGPSRTRVHLEMSYDPEGFVENVGDMLGFVTRRVENDLQRFKDFIEARGAETGGWRGELENPDVRGGHTSGAVARGEYSDPEGKSHHAERERQPPRMQPGAYEEYRAADANLRPPEASQPGVMDRVYREDDDEYPES